MRCRALIISSFIASALFAQDWALINPAYKYNYSLGGTDTITNQIFVTQIDTLGPDSFRYALNKIARQCPECMPTCNVQVDVPQFLMREVRVYAGEWDFIDTAVFVIRPEASVGAIWLFDPLNGTNATVVTVEAGWIFGTTDSIRLMVSTLNDTVRWSKEHGIVTWHLSNGPRFELIGMQAPGTGLLVPSLAEFFRYQPGDIVQFASGWNDWTTYFHYWTCFHVQQRIEQPGHLEFFGTAHRKMDPDGGAFMYFDLPSFTWVLDSSTQLDLRPLGSWPGQFLRFDGAAAGFTAGDMHMLAKHHRDSTGTYIITGEAFNGSTMFGVIDSPSVECLHVGAPFGNEYQLDTELGLRVRSWEAFIESSYFRTVGAVIDGDTIGTVNDDGYYHVGIEDHAQPMGSVGPVPAYDHIDVGNAFPGDPFSIVDLFGRTLLIGTLDQSGRIDLLGFPSGCYVLLLERTSPVRFEIVR